MSKIWVADRRVLTFAGPFDGTLQVFDMGAGTPPASPKMLSVEMRTTAAGGLSGAAPAGDFMPNSHFVVRMTAPSIMVVTFPVFTSFPNLIQLAQDGVADTVFTLLGWWAGDGVVGLPPAMSQIAAASDAEADIWREYDLTSLVGADDGNVEAVLLTSTYVPEASGEPNEGHADARAVGSTWPSVPGRTPHSLPLSRNSIRNATTIVKVDDDNRIEVIQSGAVNKFLGWVTHGLFWVAGYIKRGLHDDGTGALYRYTPIVDPVDDAVGSSAWTALDTRPATTPFPDTVVSRLQFTGDTTPKKTYVREVGSGVTERDQAADASLTTQYPLVVDSAFEIEHYLAAADTESWIFGYVHQTPDQATSPSPPDTAIDVLLNATLSWTPGARTSSHDVYFGTNPAPGAGEFQDNQPGATFDPGALDGDTTYFWRIDEVNPAGTTTGVVWSFTTAPWVVCVDADASAFPRVDGVSSGFPRVDAAASGFVRVDAVASGAPRVLATPTQRPRVKAEVSICGKVVNMKANALCPDELAWNADNVLDLAAVVDDLVDPATPITSGVTGVTCEIFDVDSDPEVELTAVSPVTLNQVASTNHWQGTVLVNTANGFLRKMRLRLVYKFNGGAGRTRDFEVLSVVSSKPS